MTAPHGETALTGFTTAMAMPTLEARRSPRVSYHAAVELLAQLDDDEGPRTLSAEALDLGAGGMRVAVAERMAVGAQLTCRITLDGRTTALAGHVVWLRAHTAPGPHGMGIRFDGVPDYEQRLLSHVIDRSCAGYRPVQLQFEGSPSPIVARALPHASGLTLSAALPILDRGTGVEVQLDAESPALRGHVAEVRVVEHEARRRLEVEIAFGDAEGMRLRREARYAPSGELLEVPQLTPADAARGPAARPTADRAASRTGAFARGLATLALGVVGGLALSARLPDSTGRQPQPSSLAPSAPVTGVDAAPALPTAPAEPPATPAAPAAEATVATAATHESPTPAAPAAPAAPSVSIDGNATTLRIPFTGTLEGMVARTWATPPTLALDLPGGRTQLARGAHALEGGSITGLRVNARGGASLLRVHLAHPITRYAVSAHEGVLELRLLAAP